GVATDVNVFDVGSQMLVLNEPAANASTSLPEPATSSTLPVGSSAAWMARIGDGAELVSHVPTPHAPSTTTAAPRTTARQAGADNLFRPKMADLLVRGNLARVVFRFVTIGAGARRNDHCQFFASTAYRSGR